MSGFKALNIESDDESDIEIDDTKEIQIEDALKLYQSALKYHADGPDYYTEAAEAYRQLFESDIFKYPESQTELRRIELYDLPSDLDNHAERVLPVTYSATSNLDNGPSTLPQILHLAHKNYAQFKLDALSARFEAFNLTLRQILSEASAALDHFVDALDKDDSDLDLWRRTAAVGEILDSSRVARFCLEAVLDGDEEGMSSIWSLPGLYESLAGHQLRFLIRSLEDDLSILQSPLSPGKRKLLSKYLKQRLRPYDKISSRQKALKAEVVDIAPVVLQPKELATPQTWAQFGDILVQEINTQQHGGFVVAQAPTIIFGPREETEQDLFMTPGRPQSDSPMLQIRSSEEYSFPTAIDEVFPGLDAGCPTVQPAIACADSDLILTNLGGGDQDIDMCQSPTVALPTRKRSGDAAGINEGTDEGRVKSRRIRARDSIADAQDNKQALIEANIKWEFEQKINEIQAADDWMYETVGGLFEKVGIVGFDAARHVRQDLGTTTEISASKHGDKNLSALRTARSDIQSCLQNWNDPQAMILLTGDESSDKRFSAHSLGFSGIFGEQGSPKERTKTIAMPDHGLEDFVRSINQRELLTHEAAWDFVRTLAMPVEGSKVSAYIRYLWSDELKRTVVRLLVSCDHYFFQEVEGQLSRLKQSWRGRDSPSKEVDDVAELIETIFELHLDVYMLIKAPNSSVDHETVIAQGSRLSRWSNLASEVMSLRGVQNESLSETLTLRFLWATTFFMNAMGDVVQDHIVECIKELKLLWIAAEEPQIRLQNNAVMSELSVSTLDNEMMKITMKDFFTRISNQNHDDPIGEIETLEPLLEVLENLQAEGNGDQGEQAHSSGFPPDLIRLLKTTGSSLRLKLWQNLRTAYEQIDYAAMVTRCQFRMIHVLLQDIKDATMSDMPDAEREAMLLQNFKLIRLYAKQIFTSIQAQSGSMDCMDDCSLRNAVSDLGEILQLVQVFNVFADHIRIGQNQPPLQVNGSPFQSYENVTNAMDEMQIHIWINLYTLLKEAIAQNQAEYTTPDEDRFEFLRTVHRSLGLRCICGAGNRVFVRMLKDEFFGLTHVEGYDSEQAQVLYDLYDLNCFLNPSYELIEHHCTHDAFLDRAVAAQAVDLLLMQASKLSMKDLVKHTLKDAIEKVHGSVSRKKPTEAVMRNRDLYRVFTRSPIEPLGLFHCLKGEGNHLPTVTVPREDAQLAFKGWYFLMGNIALTRFRSQKRTAPAPTEDLDIAIAFFNQDLEATMDHWETWFRLAQAYDSKIEESVVWSAEKLNNAMPDVVQLQRSAIHCYTMATALAYRSASPTFETAEKMNEMYADFATRLYSSSREPFGMLAFANDEVERYVSTAQSVYKQKSFGALTPYTVWKLANVLFKRALAGNSSSWNLHYMVGKCLWKMHSAPDEKRRHNIAPTGTQVLQAFVRALELLPPDKKDSRDTRREPNLEPHYKLASIVHKLILRDSITLEEAKQALEHTQYARNEDFPSEKSDWTPFILKVMKNLRTADKSNWYHRMIARSAQIVYETHRIGDEERNANDRALAAKHELTQQMFTKTMALQVWRPEGERAGRHFVYTSRYTRFFVQILKQLKDRSSLEQLARKVRRRPHDMFEHSNVWQEICMAYLKLLRNSTPAGEGLETAVFSVIAHDEFLERKECLADWMQRQETGKDSTLDVLREVTELKKINQSLMKPGYIDDLIGDSYAYLFENVGRRQWEMWQWEEEENRRQAESYPSPLRNPVMNLNHLMNDDGAGEESSGLNTPAVAPAATDAAPARRKIGVGRREIRAAAEACMQKTGTTPGSAIKRSDSSNTRAQLHADPSDNLNVPADAAQDISAPGSIHDSADESELSELEEEDADDEASIKEDESLIVKKPMFPGLAASPAEDGKEDADEFETADEGQEDDAEEPEADEEQDGEETAEVAEDDDAMEEDNDVEDEAE